MELLIKLRHYAAIIDSSDDAIISKTLDGIVITWNYGACQMFGYSSEEMVGQSIKKLIPVERLQEEALFLEKIRNGETVTHYETIRQQKDSSLIDVSVSLSPIRNEDGVIVGASKIARNISARKQAENALLENEKRFRFIMENSPIAVRIVSKETGKVIYANQNFAKLLGCSLEEALDVNPREYYVNPLEYDEIVQRLIKGEIVLNQLVKLQNSVDTKWALASFMGTNFENKPVYLGWLYDISERKLIEDQATHLALYDPLTMLPNRRMLDERLKLAMESNRQSGFYGAIMFIDLDKFKSLNDTHGHEYGDLLLIEVSRRISYCLRENDMVARFGGDEFVVLLSEIDENESKARSVANKVAEKIRLQLEEVYKLKFEQKDVDEEFVEHHSSASIGITIFGGMDENATNILKRVDEAMYLAKKAGRNTIHLA